ncbi:MAG: hypothetical protein ACIAQF_09635 [Phycisphaerales bacterium JB065]
MIAVLSLCAVTESVASAGVVQFVNDGSFDWTPSFSTGADYFFGNQLDITQDASQSGDPSDISFGWDSTDPTTSSDTVTNLMFPTGPGGLIASEPLEVGEVVDGSSAFGLSLGISTFSFGNGRVPLLGQSVNVGVSIQLEGMIHYGWIRLEWMPGTFVGSQYQPVAWAYETKPGVAIAVIPAPAALTSFSMLALVGLRRRR